MAHDPQDALDAWSAMWRDYDLDGIDEVFWNDDRVTLFSSQTEGLIQGLEAIRAHHDQLGFVAGGVERPNALWLEDVRMTSIGDHVLVTALWFFRAGPEEAPRFTQPGAVTFVLTPTAEGYRISHVQFGAY